MIDPRSSRTEGYHLFLEPTGRLKDELSSIISKLAEEYEAPVFIPHVTVLARIPAEDEAVLVARTEALAKMLSPFELTFEGLDMEDIYFRALYLQAQSTKELTECHAQAVEIFDMEDSNAYRPHLSLLYGNYPAARKQETINILAAPLGSSFLVDRVHLYKTEGEAHAWRKMGEYPFARSHSI